MTTPSLWDTFSDNASRLTDCDWTPIEFLSGIAMVPGANQAQKVLTCPVNGLYRKNGDWTWELRVGADTHSFRIGAGGSVWREFPSKLAGVWIDNLGSMEMQFVVDAVVACLEAQLRDRIMTAASALEPCSDVEVAFTSCCEFGQSFHGRAGPEYRATATVGFTRDGDEWTVSLDYPGDHNRRISYDGRVVEEVSCGIGCTTLGIHRRPELEHMLAAIMAVPQVSSAAVAAQ